jgi:hypothetical protein
LSAKRNAERSFEIWRVRVTRAWDLVVDLHQKLNEKNLRAALDVPAKPLAKISGSYLTSSSA